MKQPLGVILAGGQATRMGGGDKGLLPLGQGTLLSSVIDRLEPQVAGLALNANGDAARFAELGLPVLADSIEGFAGPLAGVLAATIAALALMPRFGFPICAAGLAIVTTLCYGERNPWLMFGLPILAAAIISLGAERVLGIPLP